MIRNETFRNGICTEADCYDLDNRWYQREEHGVVVLERAMTADEWRQYGPQPLTGISLVAALNAALGVWNLSDAANIAQVSEEDLINEVLAWAAAGEAK